MSLLLQPFGWLMWGSVLALLIVWYRHPDGRQRLRPAAALMAAALLYSLPLTAGLANLWLEGSYPPVVTPPDNLGAIVVLGGGIIPPQHPDDITRPNPASLARVLRGYEVWQQTAPPHCPLLISGGHPHPAAQWPAPARTMADTLLTMQMPADQLIVEPDSRNTRENARNSAAILRERGITGPIMVVSSANHLWRARLLFEKQGFEVIPVGCEFHAPLASESLPALLWPRAGAVDANQRCAHEVLGVIVSWLRGDI